MRETILYFKCTYSRTFKINKKNTVKNHKDKIPRQKKKWYFKTKNMIGTGGKHQSPFTLILLFMFYTRNVRFEILAVMKHTHVLSHSYVSFVCLSHFYCIKQSLLFDKDIYSLTPLAQSFLLDLHFYFGQLNPGKSSKLLFLYALVVVFFIAFSN